MKLKLFCISIIFMCVILDSQAQNIDNDKGRTINIIYKNKIDSMYRIDQNMRNKKYLKIRNNIARLLNKKSLSNRQKQRLDKLQTIRKQQQETDKSNTKTLLALIQKYGYPSEKNVGLIGYNHAYIIFLHFDYDVDNKILKPIFDKALKNNEILPSDYATVLDRHLVTVSNKKPYYYELNLCDYLKLSEEEQKIVSERRKSIGLKPRKVKCSTFGKYHIIK